MVIDRTDAVFKALADPTRRLLLDRLFVTNGQSLGTLCESLDMSRQAITQHLTVLEDANLISTLRQGRSKLHYLNPVAIEEIRARWINKFEAPRLGAIGAVKKLAEDAMTDKPSFVYVTYIASTPEKVWDALTDADVTAQYWGHRNVSDWQPGSTWEHQRLDGSGIADVVGTVEESMPPSRLVTTWADPEDTAGKDVSRVSFDIESLGAIVRLTVTHTDLADESARRDVAGGWSAVLSNMKSYLETGSSLPVAPWEATAD